jgi:hypothetical protein
VKQSRRVPGRRSRPAHSRAPKPTTSSDRNPVGVLPVYVPKDRDKNQFAFLLGEDFIEKHNIAWRIELAEDDPAHPILEPEFPWESAGVFSYGTVLQDPTDGLWKAWYISAPEHKFSPSAERRLTYAESEDGIHWVRPKLNICRYPGYSRTNILLDLKSGGPAQHASVIIHPEAPPDYRYEMFVIRLPGWECPYRVVKGFSVPAGEPGYQKGAFSPGIYRYRSADGKHWQPWQRPKLETADGGWITQLDDGSYVAYHKMAVPALPGGVFPYDVAAGICRILVRRTSKSGSEWSAPELVFTPDWQDAHDTQFMELTPLQQRGGFVGLVTVYHTLNQTIDLQFAGSRDGRSWWRPDRRACVPLRPLGDFGGGMIWPMNSLIPHNGRTYLYYAGCQGLHNDYQSTEPIERMRAAKFPFWPHYYQALPLGKDVFSPVPGNVWYYSALGRVSWESGRLWAAVTASGGPLYGDLLTRDIAARGKKIVVNVVTAHAGSLEAELVKGGKPIRGFSRSDCTPIRGDQSEAAVRWKGGDRCPANNAQIRFYLSGARFYGFDLQDA